MKCGADIVEINTIRKHLSAVKGGKFAKLCAPAQVYCIVLSDILGDRPDSIASYPCLRGCVHGGRSICHLGKKYNLKLTEEMRKQLAMETPKTLANVTMEITGSVTQLCADAARAAEQLGYAPLVLTNMLDCEARECRQISCIHRKNNPEGRSAPAPALCDSLRRRNRLCISPGRARVAEIRELALAAAERIAGMEGIVIAAAGSDGTDGKPMPQAVLWTGKPAVSLRKKRAFPFLRFLRRMIPMPHWRRQMPFSSQGQPAQT